MVTPLLHALYWLPVHQWINYKLSSIFCHWHQPSNPCWHSQDLCSFPTASFLLWHLSVWSPFCQYKVNWLTYFCTPRPYSLKQTPTHQACSLCRCFQNYFKNWTFLSARSVIFSSSFQCLGGGGGGTLTLLLLGMCVRVCVEVILISYILTVFVSSNYYCAL